MGSQGKGAMWLSMCAWGVRVKGQCRCMCAWEYVFWGPSRFHLIVRVFLSFMFNLCESGYA
jgi:hypothetical protein